MKIKKTIAAIAAAAMVFTSLPMIAFADTVEHADDHKLTYSNNSGDTHDVTCSVTDCNYSGETGVNHTFDKYNTETAGKHTKECVCGKAEGAAEDCTVTTWTAGESGKHTGTCTICGQTVEKDCAVGTDTKFYPKTGDDTKHVQKCGDCGSEINAAAHTPAYDEDGTADEGKHAMKCSVCGKTGLTAADCVESGWKKDADGHWKVCTTCGKEIAESAGEHTQKTEDDTPVWGKNKEKHWKECACGWVIADSTADHVYDQEGDKCVCGLTEATAAEAGETAPPENPEAGDTRPTTPETPETPEAPVTPVTPVETPEAPAASSSSSSSSESSSSSSTGAAASTTVVSSPAEVRTATKANVTVNAAETKVTPAIVNAFTKNSKTKTLTIDYGKNKVAIAKDDVKDAAAANLDFSVSGKNFISTKAIKSSKTLSKAEKVVQVDFVQEGKFNGIDKVTVKNRVGGKYAGQKATVYEYVNGKLVKIATVKVGGSGLVSFKIDHFGQYVIAVD